MDLKELKRNWNKFGKKDPLWAILTDPKKKGNKWDPENFFKTGEEEIWSVLNHIHSLDISFSRNKALDFGCGVGRLTQALCRDFKHCYGVDIAQSMINLAKKYNRYGERCKYYLNETSDLTLFEDNSFDFICSSIVLQHMKPEYSKRYIREFLRVLAPGGVLVFQIPSEFIPAKMQRAPNQNAILYGLPSSAFKAQITISDSFMTAHTGTQMTLPVKVKNISDVTWPAFGATDGRYQIRLGNHWLDDGGRLLVQDDGRACFQTDLKPLEETTLSLKITTLGETGNYILELDMVQEWVAWFKDKGSETVKIQFHLTERQDRVPQEGKRNKNLFTSEPIMEMYGTPRDIVLKLIAESGGKIIDLQEDKKAGEEWFSFTYYVTKATAADI